MNEFTRVGKGDEYVEVCVDWQGNWESSCLWKFKECLGDSVVNTDEFKKLVREVFDL